MKSRHPRALLLLAKYPEPGSVKTRLVNGTEDNGFNGLKHIRDRTGTPVGDEKAQRLAADLYRAFLTDRFRAHQVDAYHLYLGTSQPEHDTLFRAITGDNVLYQAVQGDNLGDMMNRIFKVLLDRYQRVIISGSDFPYVSESIVEQVFYQLDSDDIVLVPAFDGAYNMIGMSRHHNIFRISKWSSGSELQETIHLLRSKQITHSVFEKTPLLDVDTIGDLRSTMTTLRQEQAPVSFAVLESMRSKLQLME